MQLTDQDYAEIIGKPSPFFYPAESGQKIEAGGIYNIHAKVGGDYRIVSVMARGQPYKKGKTSQYVDVFGYDFRGSVNVKKLMLHR